MVRFSEEMRALKAKGLKRTMRFVSSAANSYITIDKRKLLNLCSNNYLGLANDQRLKDAAGAAMKKFGLGSGASRLMLGSTILHKKLEEKIAQFKKQEASLVYTSGYSANLGIISSLVGRNDVVFSDRLNHASIIDGIILSRAELVRYPHKDIGALERLLRIRTTQGAQRTALIITDSVFSMDGDIAPIPELFALAKEYNCLLMIDEAHATGVLGKKGRGALEYFGINPDERIIQMGTLSKALGCLGGFVCGSKDLIDYLVNRSRSFIFSTALPAAICASAIEAIKIIEKDDALRQRLKENASFLRQGLKNIGFDTLDSKDTAIIPLLTKEPALTMEFSRKLFAQRIYAQGIRPPTVPEGLSRLRLSVMATHTIKDLKSALVIFKRIGQGLGIV